MTKEFLRVSQSFWDQSNQRLTNLLKSCCYKFDLGMELGLFEIHSLYQSSPASVLKVLLQATKSYNNSSCLKCSYLQLIIFYAYGRYFSMLLASVLHLHGLWWPVLRRTLVKLFFTLGKDIVPVMMNSKAAILSFLDPNLSSLSLNGPKQYSLGNHYLNR